MDFFLHSSPDQMLFMSFSQPIWKLSVSSFFVKFWLVHHLTFSNVRQPASEIECVSAFHCACFCQKLLVTIADH